METKNQATERPWEILTIAETEQTNKGWAIRKDHITLAVVCSNEEDARLIVKAVNCHDELVESVKEAVNAMKRMDRLLLKLTDSPFECEKGEIVRAERTLAKAQQ